MWRAARHILVVKKRQRKTWVPWLSGTGNLVAEDMVKTEVLNSIFCLIFYWKDLPSQVPELTSRVFVNKSLLTVEEDRVRDCFSQLDRQVHVARWDACKGAKRSVWRHCKASITLKRLWSEKVLNDWEKANVTPVCKKGKEDPCNWRPYSLTSVPGKIMKQIVLEGLCHFWAPARWGGDWEQHGLTEGKLCLTNSILFYENMNRSVDELKAVEVVYIVSHSVLTANLVKDRWDK